MDGDVEEDGEVKEEGRWKRRRERWRRCSGCVGRFEYNWIVIKREVGNLVTVHCSIME